MVSPSAGSLEVDDQLELYCLLNRQISAAGAVEDSAGVDVGHAIGVGEIGDLQGDPIGALGAASVSAPRATRESGVNNQANIGVGRRPDFFDNDSAIAVVSWRVLAGRGVMNGDDASTLEKRLPAFVGYVCARR